MDVRERIGRVERALIVAGVLGVALLLAGMRPPVHVAAGMACDGRAWPTVSDLVRANRRYPDTNATYWLYTYNLRAGEELLVDGVYPSARYMSLTTHTVKGVPIEHLYDAQIAPDFGSRNPFVTPNAPSDPSRRRYSLRVTTKVPPGVGLPGTLAAGPAIGPTTGVLMYRVYLPDDAASPAGGVPLPALSLRTRDGTVKPIPLCEHPMPDTTDVAPLSIDAPDAERPLFVRRQGNGSPYTNFDNAYVAAKVHWQPGRVVIVRGKAPSFPDTRNGESVTTPSQLRYWSVCSNELRLPLPVDECVADYEVPVDAAGYYTIVMSAPQDRPANAALEDGVAWLRWNPDYDGAIILRNMLPAWWFQNAAQDTAQGSFLLLSMGDYAPRAVYCDTSTFEQGACAMP